MRDCSHVSRKQMPVAKLLGLLQHVGAGDVPRHHGRDRLLKLRLALVLLDLIELGTLLQ
jgi:hypothetical protein